MSYVSNYFGGPGVIMNGATGCAGFWGPWPCYPPYPPYPPPCPPGVGGNGGNGGGTNIPATPSGGTNIPATPSGGTNIPAEPVLPDPAVPTEPEGPGELTSNPVKWSYKTAQDSGYPWEEPTLHVKNYPMPSSFYDVGNPQGAHVFSDPELLIRALLGSILVMADMDTSLAVASTGASLRQELSDLLAEPAYNDGLYGTTATGLAGGRRRLGAKNRGINWDARHAPVRKLLSEGKQPYRTTMLNGDRLADHLEADDAPLLWIPGVNLDILRKNLRLTTEGMRWSDGSSTLEPPPSIIRLGIDTSGVRFPGGRGYVRTSRSGTARDWWER